MGDINSMFAAFNALGPWAWIIAGVVLLFVTAGLVRALSAGSVAFANWM